MTEKFKGKYRIPSARAQWWDYKSNGAYFITICTRNRETYFGNIINGAMQLSQAGIIAENTWYGIPNHAMHAKLGAFVVMPNHIHGIIIIDYPNIVNAAALVETGHAPSLQTNHGIVENIIVYRDRRV